MLMVVDGEIYGGRAISQPEVNLIFNNMNHQFYLGESKEYMINPTTKITYNDYMMIIDFNIGLFKQSSYMFSKQELVRTEDLLAVYSFDLPQEIK